MTRIYVNSGKKFHNSGSRYYLEGHQSMIDDGVQNDGDHGFLSRLKSSKVVFCLLLKVRNIPGASRPNEISGYMELENAKTEWLLRLRQRN